MNNSLNKKIIAMLIACFMMLSVFTACNNEDDQPQSSSSQPEINTELEGEIKIIGNLENFEALDAVIEKFESVYKKAHVSYEKLDDYNNMLELRLKNDPTVACCLGADHSLALDLTEYEYNVDNFGYIIETSYVDGHLYSIPIGIDTYGLVVNTTLLESLNIKVPQTYPEFVSACETLVGKGYIPIQQAANAIGRYLFEPYVWHKIATAQDVDGFIAQLLSGEEGSLESMRPVFDLYNEFVAKKYIDSENVSKITNDYDAAILNFFKGQAAFMPASSTTLSGMKKRETKSPEFGANPFKYQFIYTPFGEDGVYAEQKAWATMSVSKYCENRELAIAFIKFMGQTESLNLLASIKGVPSAAKITDDDRFAYLNNAKGTYIHPWNYNIPYVSWNSVIGRLSEYVAGKITTVDEALRLIENDNLA